MKSNPDIHHRRSIRLKGYDYFRAGIYFITICIQNRLCLFAEIKKGEMILNDTGKMIKTVWDEIPVYYQGFNIHEFIVMPNHIHGIIQIVSNPNSVGTGPCACPNPRICYDIGQPQGVAPTDIHRSQPNSRQQQRYTPKMSLSDVVHRFKTLTTKRYTDGVKNNGWPRFNKKLWQRNYYEHIIRDEKSYHKISGYIVNNPMTWQDDMYYE